MSSNLQNSSFLIVLCIEYTVFVVVVVFSGLFIYFHLFIYLFTYVYVFIIHICIRLRHLSEYTINTKITLNYKYSDKIIVPRIKYENQ